MGRPQKESLESRFWKKVDKTQGECWIWTAQIARSGYGVFWAKKEGGKRDTNFSANQMAWILTNGPVPEGFYVRQKCDNRLCVNPEHLYLGNCYLKSINQEERFWSQVDKRDHGCWIWIGRILKSGYGEFQLPGSIKKVRAHKFCWNLMRGEVPERMRVAQSCENPLCVNPEHLVLEKFDPLRGKRLPVEERFWSHVDRSDDGCWEWRASKRNGYGIFGVNKKTIIASRFAWRLTHGDIPDGLFVLHACDNPSCVNPGHLFLGTHQDNMDDMIAKGRQMSSERKRECFLGEKHHSAKLTNEQVRDIKRRLRNGETPKDICVDYGVAKNTIFNIKYGVTWSHIDPDFTNSN